eukprot:968196-Heterocapsa_arctica.AAC.1
MTRRKLHRWRPGRVFAGLEPPAPVQQVPVPEPRAPWLPGWRRSRAAAAGGQGRQGQDEGQG